MKKFYKYTLLLLAAFLFAPLAVNADDENPQDPTNTLTGLGFTKNVTPDPDKDNAYNITLTAFTTGSTVSEAVNASVAADIVLVLDASGSMAYSSTGSYPRKGNALATGTQLQIGKNYIIRRSNGTEYIVRGYTRQESNYAGRYYFRKNTLENSATNPPTYYDGGSKAFGSNDYITSLPAVGDYFYYGGNSGERYTTTDYQVYETDLDRMEVLKDAVKKFVQVVYSKNPAEGDKHKIAIVKFASATAEGSYNGTETIYNLNDVTSGTQCNTVIDALQAGGGTQAADGLALAYNILSATGVRDDGHSKVTVFFTDGVPGQSGWDNAEARTAVNNAYNLKGLETTLKINGVEMEDENGDPIILESKVYAVGLLTSENAQNNVTNDVRRYMHYVSSNYKFNITGTSYTFNSNHTSSKKLVNTGTEENPKWEYTGGTGGDEAYDSYPKARQYYQLTDGSDLTSIFESIASSSSNAPTIPLSLKSTDIVAVDVVSQSFKLPDGANADDIQVMVAPFEGIDETGTYTDAQKSRLEHYQFGTPVTYATACNDPDFVKGTPQKDAQGKIIRDNNGVIQYESTYAPSATIDPNNRQKISVTGFNYADNWCGYDVHTENGVTTNIPHGYQLVIVIPIEVDAANPGGASVDTNDPTSGIYITNEDGTTTFAGFPQPVVTLPNIIIRKYGLLYENEGASFRLEKLKLEGSNWVVDNDVKPYYVVVVAKDNDPETFDFVQVKLQQAGRYRVTETDWGWSYNCSADLTDLEENDANDTNSTLVPKAKGTNEKGQPYIDRDVSGDTEQTITLPDGANKLAGAVYDFRNESKQHEKRNYSEAYKRNEFHTVYNPVEE